MIAPAKRMIYTELEKISGGIRMKGRRNSRIAMLLTATMIFNMSGVSYAGGAADLLETENTKTALQQVKGFDNDTASLKVSEIAYYDSGTTNADGGVMVYDITNPEKVSYVNYINSRDYSGGCSGSS